MTTIEIIAIILSALALIVAVLTFILLDKRFKALENAIDNLPIVKSDSPYLRFDKEGNAYFSEGINISCGKFE